MIRKIVMMICLATICVLFLAPSRLAAWESECPATLERLKKGEIIQEHTRCPKGITGVRSRFLVRCSKERFWRAMVEYCQFPKLFDGVESAKLIEQRFDTGYVAVVTKPTLGKQFKYTLRRVLHAGADRLSWSQHTGPFKINKGSWRVLPTPLDGSLYVVHESFVVPGGLFSDGVVKAMAPNSIRRSDQKLRQWLEAQEGGN